MSDEGEFPWRYIFYVVVVQWRQEIYKRVSCTSKPIANLLFSAILVAVSGVPVNQFEQDA